MIEINGLCFSFGSEPLLNNVCAEFAKGKFCGIIGPNGSGKTTLLKLITGQYKPSDGKVLIDGAVPHILSRREMAKKVSVLSQERKIGGITVRDYIASGRYPYVGAFGKFSEEDISAVELSAQKAGVAELMDKDISRLSGGERQRVRIAAVIAQSTSYVLLDEPTTFLDFSNMFEIMSLLKQQSREGKGVVAVLHDIPMALKFCDELLVLDSKNGISETVTSDDEKCGKIIETTFDVKCRIVNVDGQKEFFIGK